jgi:hypothetical protein
MRVTMLLCDYAQAADGKLNIIGGGWSLTGPRPTPFGIAVLFQVPWDQANARHSFRLELLDADGQLRAAGQGGLLHAAINQLRLRRQRPRHLDRGRPGGRPRAVRRCRPGRRGQRRDRMQLCRQRHRRVREQTPLTPPRLTALPAGGRPACSGS